MRGTSNSTLFYNLDVETLSRPDLRQYQLQLLNRQINYVYCNSALGRRKMEEARVNPGDIKSLEDIIKIPTITRADIQAQIDNGHDPYGGIRSISRGQRLVITYEHFDTFPPTSTTLYSAMTVSDQAILCEQFVRNLLMIGVQQGDGLVAQGDFGDQFPVALTSLNQPFRFNAGTILRCPVQCFGAYLVPKHMAGTVDGPRAAYYIHYFKAAFIIGYSEFITGLLDVCSKEKLDFGGILKRVVVVQRKGISPEVYVKLKSHWAVPIQNLLSVPENFFYAMDCPEGQGLHVWEDMFLVEALDGKTGQPVKTGETGKLTITNLFSEGSPIIRYQTGIDVRLDDRKCNCGRSHLRIFLEN